ncbi:MAG: efflux RND transporter periplasmic adaptor subunit [Candidatus Competibacter sp.]
MQLKVVSAQLSAALALSGCDKPPRASLVASVRPVLVRPVVAGSAAPVVYSGEVRARRESDLAFRVPGKIVARLVDVGARVEPGKALARLDPADLRLNADAARAQLAAAESDYALAASEQERYAALLAKKLIAQSLYDAKVTAYKAAKAKRDQAQAQLAVVDRQENYSTLSADHAGVVTVVLAEVGQVVSAGQPVLRVARPEEKEIAINVPEGQVGELRSAKTMWVTLWARPELRWPAELRELAPAADAATRTYTARIRLRDNDPAVGLGMTARVSVQPAAADETLVVPLTAVVDQGAGPAVWVVSDDKAQRRPVEIRQYREDGAVLAKGVRAGELVVTVGAHKLVAGQSVRPIVQETPAAGKPL